MTLDGHADFLAVPIPGVQGDVKLEQIALDYFKPVLNHGSVAIQGGTLSAAGAFEYGPTVRIADLKEATITGMKIEYVQTPQAAAAGLPEKAARKTAQAVQEANNAPDLVLRARRVDLVDSRVGFFNKRTTPNYRAFIDVARLQLENFTNQRTEGADDGDARRPLHGQRPDEGHRPLPAGGRRPRLRSAGWRSRTPTSGR